MRVLRLVLRVLLLVAVVLLLTALLAAFGALAALGEPRSDGRAFCAGGDPFHMGDCKLGAGSIMAIIALVLVLAAAATSWALPLPVGAATRDSTDKPTRAERRRHRRHLREAHQRRRAAARAAATQRRAAEERTARGAPPHPQTPQRQQQSPGVTPPTAPSQRQQESPGVTPTTASAPGSPAKRKLKRRRKKRQPRHYEPARLEAATVRGGAGAGGGAASLPDSDKDSAPPPRHGPAGAVIGADEMDAARANAGVGGNVVPPAVTPAATGSANTTYVSAYLAEDGAESPHTPSPTRGGMWWDPSAQHLATGAEQGAPIIVTPRLAPPQPSALGGPLLPSPLLPRRSPGQQSTGSQPNAQYEAIDDVLESIAAQEDREAEALFLASQLHAEQRAAASAAGSQTMTRLPHRASSVHIMPPRHRHAQRDNGSSPSLLR